MSVILLIVFMIIGALMAGLPYYVAGGLFRVCLQRPRQQLVALLCAVVLVFASGFVQYRFAMPSFRMVMDLSATTLTKARVASEPAAFLGTCAILIGGFAGALAVPFLLAYAGVRTVDLFRKKKNPNIRLEGDDSTVQSLG